MHRSENQAPGVIHQHFFFGATETLPVAAGDKLVSYVYLNPANPPTQIMLQWHATDGSGWEHRAYWGANQIPWGTDGTESRRYQGPLPATGQWVRLEVDAASVGLEGRTISGIAYSQVGGQADWDHSGKVSATGVETLYVDDALPQGAVPNAPWTWSDTGLTTAVAFTGHHYHPRSTLHLAPYRAYSAELGRWLSRDPIGEGDGPNIYLYTKSRPVRFVDFSGLMSFGQAISTVSQFALGGMAIGAAGGALAGGAAGAIGGGTLGLAGGPAAPVTVPAAGAGGAAAGAVGGAITGGYLGAAAGAAVGVIVVIFDWLNENAQESACKRQCTFVELEPVGAGFMCVYDCDGVRKSLPEPVEGCKKEVTEEEIDDFWN
jgi:RHS repeat-associated protein